jgi:hypothetical protein
MEGFLPDQRRTVPFWSTTPSFGNLSVMLTISKTGPKATFLQAAKGGAE